MSQTRETITRCSETDAPNWRLRARCRFLVADLFFAPEHESRGEKIRRERAARELCALCPVLVPCRDHAVGGKEKYGVWGGLTEAQRRPVTGALQD
ncbi:WhiB family transcriptional regulator [Rhodococcus opacus]|uniref:Transcriptional regulator WhiB n=1 Tax=Rhodococcus opacus TaxID=37919 RepID=A0A2S8IG39_RHOOP|nr:WhiB family transcriptional regulator [Rhodococcus opacus]PQP13744.1 WhiB family transcriptional regulator [Rhodococcus opacus]